VLKEFAPRGIAIMKIRETRKTRLLGYLCGAETVMVA